MSRILAILLPRPSPCSWELGRDRPARLAQTQSTTPSAHAGTKLIFAPTVGGATFERSVQLCRAAGQQPGLGTTYFYSTSKQDDDHRRRSSTAAGACRPAATIRRSSTSSTTKSDRRRAADQGGELHQFPEARGAVDLHLRRGDLPLHRLQRVSQAARARLQQDAADRLPAGYFVKIRIDWSARRNLQQTRRGRPGAAALSFPH